jgi:hypothetical protein
MAAGPGSLFSDVPSYRQCEGTMADLTGKAAIVTGTSKAPGGGDCEGAGTYGGYRCRQLCHGREGAERKLQDRFDHLVTAGALYA